MNRNFTRIIFFLLTFCSLGHGAYAQTWQQLGSGGFSSGSIQNPCVRLDASGNPWVAYQDMTKGGKATVRKFNGNSWEDVGLAGFSIGEVSAISLAFDGSGNPYVAYEDFGTGNRATVKKFTGSTWVDVGAAGFSAGQVNNTRLAIDAAGTPFVAYMDFANGLKATVKKYTGSGWVNVGPAGFSADRASYLNLVLDAAGNPYVAYQDGANGYKATVRKFEGGSWVDVGAAGFSAGGTAWMSLALSKDGVPFVAYQDQTNFNKASVMKFNGTNWVGVGSAGFSGGQAYYVSLAVDASGSPFVAYQDYANGFKATVRKFDGSNWIGVGGAGFSAGQASETTLSLNASGNPVLAYRDASLGKGVVMKFAQAPIAINPQPQGTTIYGGEPTSFSVGASGSGTLTYQWQVSYDGGTNFSNITNGYVYSGATTPTLTLTKAPISLNGNKYRVLVSNGEVLASQPASLTVQVAAFDNGRVWQPLGMAGISAGAASFTSLVLSPGGIPLIAYKDAENGDKATVRKYSGTNWEDVGLPGFSAGPVNSTSLTLDSEGKPFVAYADGSAFEKATVQKFDGSNWVLVGTPASTSTQAFYTASNHLKVDAEGKPLIVYSDFATGGNLVIRKFDGSNWAQLGTANFAQGPCYYPTLALDPAGIPVVAYTDMARGYQLMVKRYTAGGWADVGPPGVSPAWANYSCLAFDENGTPYVAYQDNNTWNPSNVTKKITVKKFDGHTWVNVGDAGFSAGPAEYISLVLDGAGVPFVSFQDGANGKKVTVMRFNGTGWEVVGIPGFSAGIGESTSLALDDKGNPYIAYRDGGNGNKATVMRFAGSPIIQTGPVAATTYCAGMSLQVPFTASGTFDSNQVFTVQLSDASGSFAAATAIGSGSKSPVSALIPANTAIGSGYRLRVVSLTPSLIGEDNGSNLRVSSPPAQPGLITGPPTICPEETGIAYAVSPVPEATSYSWVLPADWRILSGQGSATILVATGASGGQVSVMAKNECGQSAATSLAVAVTFPVGGNLLVADQHQTICRGSVPQFLEGPALTRDNSTITYLWESSTTGPTAGFTPAPGLNTAKDYVPVSGTLVTTWFRRRVMPGSCLAAATYSNAIQISVTELPKAPEAAPVSRCGPGLITLVASGAAGSEGYRWYTQASGGVAIAGENGASFTTPLLATSTPFYVSAVNAKGCESARTAVMAVVYSPPAITAGEPRSSCINEGAFILSDFSPAGGTWSGPGVTAGGIFSPAAAGLGTHALTYRINQNGCSVSATKTITVRATPGLSLPPFTQSVCSNNVSLILNKGVPAGGAWSGRGISEGNFNASIAGVGTHTLTYRYTDASGCAVSASQEVTVVSCTYFKEDRSVSRLLLYPNPTAAKFKVDVLLKSPTSLTYRVFSPEGKIVMEKTFAQVAGDFSHVFDMQGKAKGLYLLQQITDTGLVTKQFILQ